MSNPFKRDPYPNRDDHYGPGLKPGTVVKKNDHDARCCCPVCVEAYLNAPRNIPVVPADNAYRPGIDIPPNSVMAGWMQSYTGRQMWPLALTPDQVHLEDIAHALALKVRFNGHCKWHYSIAQHSVLVSLQVPADDMIEGLMHDAAEAYLADIPRPVKPMIAEWKALEYRVEAAIATRFGYRFPYPDSVKIADNAVVLAERDVIMAVPQPHMKWDVPGEPADVAILEWTWRSAERIFLDRAEELGVK